MPRFIISCIIILITYPLLSSGEPIYSNNNNNNVNTTSIFYSQYGREPHPDNVDTDSCFEMDKVNVSGEWVVSDGPLPYKEPLPGCRVQVGEKSWRLLHYNVVDESTLSIVGNMSLRAMKELKRITQDEYATFLDIPAGMVSASNPMYRIQLEKNFFPKQEMESYIKLIKTIKQIIIDAHHIKQPIYIAHPCPVQRHIPPESANRTHKIFWRTHSDRVQASDHFDWSVVLYFSTFGVDFSGGYFEFHDKSRISFVEPERGMMVSFSSGTEHMHRISDVESGMRLSIVVWWTCEYDMRDKSLDEYNI
jgi:hypothetical protein